MIKRYTDLRGSFLPSDRYEGFRCGSETCARFLPSAAEVARLSDRTDGARLCLVTPIAGPDEIDAVADAAREVRSRGWGEVVVNDWGVLERLRTFTGLTVTAGRLLMRFRRGPGQFDPWVELDETSRRYFAWGPLWDSPFLDFLARMGVSRIELDPPRHWLPPPEDDRFRYSLHLSTRLVSVSADCPWLYDEGSGTCRKDTGCGAACRAGDIRMTSPHLGSGLFLRDRGIHERVEDPPDPECFPPSVDRMICDSGG